MKRILIVIMVLTGLLVAKTPAAEAHEIKRADCARYAAMHAFVVGAESVRRTAFLRCWRKAKQHALQHPLPDWMIPATLRRIRECESGGNYRAQNPVSTASGAYQYLDSTWGGHLGYAKARLAPPRVQDRRALRDFNNVGTTPWAASQHCWG